MRPLFERTPRADLAAAASLATPRTRAHSSRTRGAGGGPEGGAVREARAERRESVRGDPRPPGGRGAEAARGGLWAGAARAVGTCSPRASRRLPQVGGSALLRRLPAAAETTPPAILSAVEPEAETNCGLRGCCPPQGAAARSPPLLRPPAR